MSIRNSEGVAPGERTGVKYLSEEEFGGEAGEKRVVDALKAGQRISATYSEHYGITLLFKPDRGAGKLVCVVVEDQSNGQSSTITLESSGIFHIDRRYDKGQKPAGEERQIRKGKILEESLNTEEKFALGILRKAQDELRKDVKLK